MGVRKPVQYRAVHTKTRWRKAGHETFENALGHKRGAAALFAGRNSAVSTETHGAALYVVIWDESSGRAEIVKADPAHVDGIARVKVNIEVAAAFDMCPPSDTELERYFETSAA